MQACMNEWSSDVRIRKFLDVVMWMIHPWWEVEASMKNLTVRILNHWYLLDVYYVQSALTFQDNLLEDNRNIPSTRHWLAPLGIQDGKLSSNVHSPIAEEGPVMYSTPWIGLSGGLIYLLFTHRLQAWAIHQELDFLVSGDSVVIDGLWI